MTCFTEHDDDDDDDEIIYLSGAFLALVRGRKNVELRTVRRQGTLVDVHPAQVNINTTRPSATKRKNTSYRGLSISTE